MEAVQKHRGIPQKVQMGRDVTESDQGSGEKGKKDRTEEGVKKERGR